MNSQNSKAVFITALKEKNIIGLRDRDFLTDDEIASIEARFPNYKILRFYSYESYLYHPSNIWEILNGRKTHSFNIGEYKEEIRKQKNDNYESIILSLRDARKGYEELKHDEFLKKGGSKERDLREGEIVESLKSDHFLQYYKYFNMKKYFNKKILEEYNITEHEYTKTDFFRKSIADLIGVDLGTYT